MYFNKYKLSIVFLASCYERIKNETQEMQQKIEADLGLNPIEQDVIVLYEGETLDEVKKSIIITFFIM